MAASSYAVVRLLVILNLFQNVLSSTHWVVTEDGRIQAQMDSLFQLRRPYDLVALLQQEERAQIVESLKKELIAQKADIDHSEDKENNLEQRLYTTDEDCVSAGQPLTEFDLYIGTVLPLESRGIRVDDYLVKYNKASLLRSLLQPICTNVMDLDFSMHAFEHFECMQERQNLSITAETSLLDAISEFENILVFGDLVHEALVMDKTSWVIYNLAAYYWRVIGDAYNALECTRRALHFSPREHKDVSLVNLANILHRAHNPAEAAVVAHAAIDIAPGNAISHFTLGNIFAIMADYNKSIISFQNALNLQPDFDAARKRLNAVACQNKVEKALEVQHSSLQKRLSELREYQRQHELWIQYQEKLLSEQAPPEVRLESRLEYEEQKIRQSLDGRGKDCFQYRQFGHTFLSCNMRRDAFDTSETKLDLSLNLQLLRNMESKAEKLEEAVSKQKALNSKNDSTPPASATSNFSQPTKPPRYPHPVDSKPIRKKDAPYLHMNWPTAEDCKRSKSSVTPSLAILSSLHLPSENKGFEIEKFLAELQELNVHDEFSLSRQTLECGSLDSTLEPYDSLVGVAGRQYASQEKKMDHILQQFLLKYVGDGVSLEEIGQQIVFGIKKSIGASWLLCNLAALYLRSLGDSVNAIECLRNSLKNSPKQFKDIPLINLASLLLKLGHGDDALALATEAYEIDEYQPETNFLLGYLLTQKYNFSGAAEHYKRVLQQDPNFQDTQHYLLSVSCLQKFRDRSQFEVAEDSSYESKETNLVCSQNECFNDGTDSCVAVMECVTQPTSGNWKNKESFSGTFQSNSGNGDVVKNGDNNIDSSSNKKLAEKKNPLGTGDDLKMSESSEEGRSFEQELQDDPLPDILSKAKERYPMADPNLPECMTLALTPINLRHFTSTWLSVSAKNINIHDFIDMKKSIIEDYMLPHCDSNFPASAHTLDHLAGIKFKGQLLFAPELGLKEAFQTLGREGEQPQAMEVMATRIALAMQKNSTSWILTTLAALYWRVMGNAEEAINCLRQALHFAPRPMKDIPLISLANIFHRAGFYNDALIVTNMALEISPKFVVIHFTLANIYAAKGDLKEAKAFYESTLALQSTFEPAKDRLHSILCQSILKQNGKKTST